MSIHKTLMEFLDNLLIYTTSPVLEITYHLLKKPWFFKRWFKMGKTYYNISNFR